MQIMPECWNWETRGSWKEFKCMKVYSNYIVYGPYLSKKDNRLRIALRNKATKKVKFMSYPKYLMEMHLNRYLLPNETIDHIDCNPLNNDLSNLRIMDLRNHAYEDAIRNHDVEVNCAYCNKLFVIEGKKLSQRNRLDRNQSGYFCSKTCSGKYGAEIQNGRIKPFTKVSRKNASKYRVKSVQIEISDIEVG